MKKIVLMIGFLLICSRGYATDEGKDMVPNDLQQCTANSDCAVVEVGCYKWYPIRKDQGEKFLDEYWKENACEKTTPVGDPPRIECVSERCTIVPGEHIQGTAIRLKHETKTFNVKAERLPVIVNKADT